MSIPLRLSDQLVHQAEAEARVFKRTAPKQIEYWAELGRLVAHRVNQDEILALMEGLAQIRVEGLASRPVDPDEVVAAVEEQRTGGALSAAVTRAAVVYESSRSRPGMLDRIDADGTRETGHFRDGRFMPAE
jgi:hypothetical protein